jgi:hypothetical protein
MTSAQAVVDAQGTTTYDYDYVDSNLRPGGACVG